MSANFREHRMFHGITVSFTKRKIQKYQRLLGNGRDSELHLAMAELYTHLGEQVLACKAYQAAAASLLQKESPLETAASNQLIAIYKKILALNPDDTATAEQLGREYHRRGMYYRAVALHHSCAERFTRQGNYPDALKHYHQIIAIEPGSITARQTCAELYGRIGAPQQGAQEYAEIGDICFEHQRFDGAQEYYQRAADLSPENEAVQQKLLLTKNILEGKIIPQAQASLLKLGNLNQLQQTLAEKEQIEKILRHNLRQLKQRYQQSTTLKNQQLSATQQRLDELSTYVAILKDNLEQIEVGKQRLKAQLDQEVAHKHRLAQKLRTLNAWPVQTNATPATEHPAAQVQRLEASVARLQQEKTKLEEQLQAKLAESSQRESQLRNCLADHTSKGVILEQRLTTTTRKRQDIEQKLHSQLQNSLLREKALQIQIRKLIQQHRQALQQLSAEKRQYEKKYQATQARMNVVETHSMTTLAHLHGELSRQCEIESWFSEKFHQSLQEIAELLHSQEQAIEKLAGL